MITEDPARWDVRILHDQGIRAERGLARQSRSGWAGYGKPSLSSGLNQPLALGDDNGHACDRLGAGQVDGIQRAQQRARKHRGVIQDGFAHRDLGDYGQDRRQIRQRLRIIAQRGAGSLCPHQRRADQVARVVSHPGPQCITLGLGMNKLEHCRRVDVDHMRSSRTASRSADEFLAVPGRTGMDKSAAVPPGTPGGSAVPCAISSASCGEYACGGVIIPTTRPRLVTTIVSPLLAWSNTADVLRVTSRTPIVLVVMPICYNMHGRCSVVRRAGWCLPADVHAAAWAMRAGPGAASLVGEGLPARRVAGVVVTWSGPTG